MQSDTYQSVTVDIVIFQLIQGKLAVLISKVASDPYRGDWSLPGGYCLKGEKTADTISRVLQTKAGIDMSQLGYLEQLQAFDMVLGTPDSKAVSVAYIGLAHDLQPVLVDPERAPTFVMLDNLPQLAYGQNTIVDFARQRIRNTISTTTAAQALLPKNFILAELQNIYETILEKPLETSNFRKQFLSYGKIQPTGAMVKSGAHRPARAYRFNSSTVTALHDGF